MHIAKFCTLSPPEQKANIWVETELLFCTAVPTGPSPRWWQSRNFPWHLDTAQFHKASFKTLWAGEVVGQGGDSENKQHLSLMPQNMNESGKGCLKITKLEGMPNSKAWKTLILAERKKRIRTITALCCTLPSAKGWSKERAWTSQAMQMYLYFPQINLTFKNKQKKTQTL